MSHPEDFCPGCTELRCECVPCPTCHADSYKADIENCDTCGELCCSSCSEDGECEECLQLLDADLLEVPEATTDEKVNALLAKIGDADSLDCMVDCCVIIRKLKDFPLTINDEDKLIINNALDDIAGV